jgi:hypothetical protein
MKYITRLLFASFLLTTFWSCKKEISKIYYQNGTAPVLTASTNTINLAFADADKTAVTFFWTNPNYEFSTGVSSQDVNYKLEIDTTGANFTNPNKKVITVSKELSQTFTESDFNDVLLNQLALKAGVPHNIEVRVTAGIGTNSAVPLMSNVLKYTATPYAIPPKVAIPTTGELFITGGATPKGWMSGGDAPVASQQFTQLSPTMYELASITLTGGQSYLLVPKYGDWGDKYGNSGSNNSNDPNSFDLKRGGGDILAPATTGNYKIDVDFQRGKVTVTKL